MNAARRRAGIRVVIAIAIMALAACQGTRNVDKTGGDTTILRLATFEGQVDDNGQNYGPQAFVDNLRKLSGGHLKVELTTDYGGNAPDAESRVVRAIASGEVDGGWPSTRAFANAGIPGLGVVEAPMTITSYAAEKALVSGPVAGKLLGRSTARAWSGSGSPSGRCASRSPPKRRCSGLATGRASGSVCSIRPCRPTPCVRSAPPRST